MKYFNTVILITITFLIGACSFYRIDSQETTLDFFEPTMVEKIVYVESVKDPHFEIGTVYVTSERAQSFDEVIEMMKKEAAIIGGDAITDLQSDATGTWKKFIKADLLNNAYVVAQFSAKVVKFK